MQAIVARYTRGSEEYSVVVAGHGKELTGAAPDIVAARELTDTLVKQIATEAAIEPIVVHLLEDSAVEFTRSDLDATLFEQQPEHQAGAPQPDNKPAQRSSPSPERGSERTKSSRRAVSGSAITERDSTGIAKDDATRDDPVQDDPVEEDAVKDESTSL